MSKRETDEESPDRDLRRLASDHLEFGGPEYAEFQQRANAAGMDLNTYLKSLCKLYKRES